MSWGKTLAMAAHAGIFAGLAACGSGPKADASTPTSTNVAPSIDKHCCKGKNDCKGKSGCKTDANASCAAQNECKGRGTSCPKA